MAEGQRCAATQYKTVHVGSAVFQVSHTVHDLNKKSNIFEKLNSVPEKKSVITKRRKLSLLVLWLIYTGHHHRGNEGLRFLIWFSRVSYKQAYKQTGHVIAVIVGAIPAGVGAADQGCWVIIFIISKAMGPWSEGICKTDAKRRLLF